MQNRRTIAHLLHLVSSPPPPKREHFASRRRRIQLALLFREGDTPESVLARNPGVAPNARALARRVQQLREHCPQIRSRAHVRPWKVAQCYLEHALPTPENPVLH